ncbi:kinase-like protein [Ascobolus immersus RN42]|uniref:non-specific serine/threonine protein kinase n=1 Tax=Ascobolus immersus RN42 TaxID=1160509 RepID=A0A3N4IYK8_ASCIM|nr:kinase-like protein [Ascobolus immersus RN42]
MVIIRDPRKNDVNRLERRASYKYTKHLAVHIGDTFNEGTYTIRHRLGQGVHSMVWLAETRGASASVPRFVALKIFTAGCRLDAINRHIVTAICRAKEATDRIGPAKDETEERIRNGASHIVKIFDEFSIEGQLGLHVCFVMELMGPAAINMVSEQEKLSKDCITRIILQTTEALAFLHREDIVHGDLSFYNIAFQYPASFDCSQLMDTLGEPEAIPADEYDICVENDLYDSDTDSDYDPEENDREPYEEESPAGSRGMVVSADRITHRISPPAEPAIPANEGISTDVYAGNCEHAQITPPVRSPPSDVLSQHSGLTVLQSLPDRLYSYMAPLFTFNKPSNQNTLCTTELAQQSRTSIGHASDTQGDKPVFSSTITSGSRAGESLKLAEGSKESLSKNHDAVISSISTASLFVAPQESKANTVDRGDKALEIVEPSTGTAAKGNEAMALTSAPTEKKQESIVKDDTYGPDYFVLVPLKQYNWPEILDQSPRISLIDLSCSFFSSLSSKPNEPNYGIGAPRHLAPPEACLEALRPLHSTGSDMWSFGCLVFELLAGERLFHIYSFGGGWVGWPSFYLILIKMFGNDDQIPEPYREHFIRYYEEKFKQPLHVGFLKRYETDDWAVFEPELKVDREGYEGNVGERMQVIRTRAKGRGWDQKEVETYIRIIEGTLKWDPVKRLTAKEVIQILVEAGLCR